MAFPIHVRSRAAVPSMTEDHASRAIQSKLSKFAAHVLRASVRFEDVNGPRGGVDTVCRVKVMLRGLEPVVLEERATAAREAADLAADGVERAVRRTVEKAQKRGERRGGSKAKRKATATATAKKKSARVKPVANEPPPDGSLIGRRIGRRKDNLDDATERPEKRRRDALVDTAAPGTSASDRKAGGGSTARRNSKKDDAGMTHALEDSAKTRPSRKSTRRGTNRVKPDSQLTRRTKRAIRSPRARAEKAQASRSRPSGR